MAASSAELARAAFAVTVTSAPRCVPNAWANGVLLAASSAKPSVAEAVETSSTMAITTACTLCRSIPPVAVLMAPNQSLGQFTPASAGTRAAAPATCPSTSRIVRAAYRSARAGSWVTSTSVCPPALSCRSSRPISCPVAVSSAPVGSSASSSSGAFTSARAIATRCRWPPDSRAG